jgi:hypothetical protein
MKLAPAAGTVACLWLALAGCKSDDSARREQVRRQVLQGQDLDKQRGEAMSKSRLLDDQGNLLPSDTTVATVLLPRGFTAKFTLDYEWYYDGPLPLDKVEKYLRERLDAQSIGYTEIGVLQFVLKPPLANPNGGSVAVMAYPVPGRSDWSRIHIQQPKPAAAYPQTAEEMQAEVARRAAAHRF